MSQGFKFPFDKKRESNLVKEEIKHMTDTDGNDRMFHDYGYARNLCLIWQNGKQFLLNYAYLLSGDFDPDGEMNVISLNFSSDKVTIKGYGLNVLFAQFRDHLPRLIIATDPRYIPESRSEESIVIEMQIESQS